MSIADVLYGWDAVERALPDYLEAERYYTGDVDEWFSTPKIKAMVASTGIRHRFNLASIPVTSLADRVELLGVVAPDSEETTKAVEEIWAANNLDIHYPDLITKTFYYGDAYIRVWPTDTVDMDNPEEAEAELDEADGVDDALGQAGVEFVVYDPKNVRMIYDPENHRRKLYTIVRWPMIDPAKQEFWRVDLYYADRIERWQSKPGQPGNQASDWEEYGDARPAAILDAITAEQDRPEPDDADDQGPGHILPNPFGENPFFHYRTALPYGVPVHQKAYGCQDAVNKALVTQLNVMDSAGWPERYGLVEAGAELDQAMDNPNDFDDEDVVSDSATAKNTNMKSGPGVFHKLTGMKEVGAFDAADPMAFLEPAGFYVRLMSQLTNTPLHRFDPTAEMPSGESLKTAEGPQVKMAKRQMTMASAPTVESWKFAFRTLGQQVPKLEATWAPAQSATGLSDWQEVEAKQKAGVPIDQTLVEAGYDETTVQEWLEQGSEELDLTRRVGLLATFAEGVSKLAGLVATGVMTAEQVDTVIKDITGLTVPAAPEEDRVPVAMRPPPVDPNRPQQDPAQPASGKTPLQATKKTTQVGGVR